MARWYSISFEMMLSETNEPPSSERPTTIAQNVLSLIFVGSG